MSPAIGTSDSRVAKTTSRREEWQERAKCRSLLKPLDNETVADQKAYCVGCPVLRECLMFAVKNEMYPTASTDSNLGWPVYGGMEMSERREVQRQMRRKNLL